MCNFKVGQKVVCRKIVDNSHLILFRSEQLIIGKIYTVAKVVQGLMNGKSDYGLVLKEANHGLSKGYYHGMFEPIKNISIIKEILEKFPITEEKPDTVIKETEILDHA